MALDGIDVDAEDAAVGVFEQRGIAFAADDVLVDGAGLVGGEQLGAGFLAVDFHGELVDLRGLGDGEEVGALELLGVGVVEFLVDAGGADLAVDLDVDVVVADLERREGEVGDETRTRVGARVWDRAVDDDESIRADRGRQGDEERGCQEEKRGSNFHVRNLARNGKGSVIAWGKICKKDVRKTKKFLTGLTGLWNQINGNSGEGFTRRTAEARRGEGSKAAGILAFPSCGTCPDKVDRDWDR